MFPSRYNITVGASTSAGGTVIGGAEHFRVRGAAIAREGDPVRCPACDSIGVIACSVARSSFLVGGREVALQGDLCRCRCDPPPTLIASQQAMQCTAAAAPTARAQPAPSPWARQAQPSASARPWPAALPEEEDEEEELPVAITLRIGLFFDGTGNNQANAQATAACHGMAFGLDHQMGRELLAFCGAHGFTTDGGVPDNSYGNAESNVGRLFELYPDQAESQLPKNAETAFIAVYLEGIGTSSGEEDSLYGQGLGIGATGAAARVAQAPELIRQQIKTLLGNNPGFILEKLEFDLFGFSRGAAAARHCANEWLKGPDSPMAKALPAGSAEFVPGFAWRRRQDFEINFIGLFDTVPGISNPARGDFTPHDQRNPGLDLRLRPGCARHIAQLVAEHEFRHNFSVVLSEHDIRVPGAHSDLGGGYLPRARERVLLSRPEHSEVPYSQPNRQTAAVQHTLKYLYEGIEPYGHAFSQHRGIDVWEMALPHNPRHDLGRTKRVYAAVTSERMVRGELSLVYLRVMHALALKAGVALKPVPRTHAFELPDELQEISDKLLRYALKEAPLSLSDAEMDLLRRHYIHLSANWNAARGKNNSDWDVIFINRPAKGGKRAEYPNA